MPGMVNAHQDIELTQHEFDEIRELVREITGISLSEAKHDLVYSRFRKRLRANGLNSFAQYIELVRSGAADEREQFANAITTNLTSFFREAHHFEYLKKHVIPDLSERSNRRIRMWSAGCSTGEEVYSIAVTLLQNWQSIRQFDVKLLATDLDSSVVATAHDGIYVESRIEDIEESLRRRWFSRVRGDSGSVQVDAEARKLVYSKVLNLMEPWPVKGPFQVIFCRNTVIYFTKDVQRVLFDRFAELQEVGDYLFVGHSESLSRVTDRYELVDRTVYRKTH